MQTPSFDLIREPWIPVSLPTGETTEWGLRELFGRAHEATGLAISSAATYNAVLRYLLAIAHRAHGERTSPNGGPTSPAAWLDIWKPQHFDATRFDKYLDRYQHRFDLFHDEYPFAQVQKSAAIRQPKPGGKQDATLLGDLKPIMTIQPERSINKTLARHQRNDRSEALSASEAAKALVTFQAYALGGGTSQPFNFSESPLIAGYCVLLRGGTLFETILLNLQQYNATSPPDLPWPPEGDAPWWETDEPDPDPIKDGLPRGLADFLTWRSRRVLLVPDERGLVTHCYSKQGYKVRDGKSPDPFMAFRQGADDSWNAVRFNPAKALWRDSHVLIENYHQGLDESSTSARMRPDIIEWRAQVENFVDNVQLDVAIPPLNIMVVGANRSKDEGGKGLGNFANVRMEQLSIPVKLIATPELAEVVRAAIAAAERASVSLDDALWCFCWATFDGAARLSERRVVEIVIYEPKSEQQVRLPPKPKSPPSPKRDPKYEALRAVRLATNASERFWAQLENPFHAFVRRLAEPDGRDPSISWYASVLDTAERAFSDGVFELSTDPRSTRAGILAKEFLGYRTAPLRKTIRDLRNPDGLCPTEEVLTS